MKTKKWKLDFSTLHWLLWIFYFAAKYLFVCNVLASRSKKIILECENSRRNQTKSTENYLDFVFFGTGNVLVYSHKYGQRIFEYSAQVSWTTTIIMQNYRLKKIAFLFICNLCFIKNKKNKKIEFARHPSTPACNRSPTPYCWPHFNWTICRTFHLQTCFCIIIYDRSPITSSFPLILFLNRQMDLLGAKLEMQKKNRHNCGERTSTRTGCYSFNKINICALTSVWCIKFTE